MKQQVEYIVHGFVQGVGFRFFAYKNAIANNLSGYVKNNFDGTVKIIAEGEENDLSEFLRIIEKGPSRAHVDRVDSYLTGYSGLYTGFEIK